MLVYVVGVREGEGGGGGGGGLWGGGGGGGGGDGSLEHPVRVNLCF